MPVSQAVDSDCVVITFNALMRSKVVPDVAGVAQSLQQLLQEERGHMHYRNEEGLVS